MILTIVLLLVACAVARFLFARYTANVGAANAAATAIFVAFVLGSLAHTFRLPEAATSVAVAPTDAPTDAPAASPTDAAAAAAPVQDDAKLRNVTSSCAGAAATRTYDGVGAIDVFQGGGQPAVRATDGVQLDRAQRYELLGWAAGRGGKVSARAACLLIDGRVAAKVADLYGVDRADVATALGAPALGQSGFRIVIPQGALSQGAHTVRVAVLEQDGSFAFIGPQPIAIAVQ